MSCWTLLSWWWCCRYPAMPPGTYNPKFGLSQVEQCLICPAGFFCEDWGMFEPTGPCQAGYYCIAGVNFPNPDGNFSTGVGGACPQGMYCPEGTSFPLPCPSGTYSDSLHLTDRSSCIPCSPSYFCGSGGLTHPSGFCKAGFYCPGGDTSSTGSEGGPCPAAHFCAEGSASPEPCPAGSYSNLTGRIVCSHCPAGYYCPERTANFTEFPCPPGFYCPDGTRHATQFPCPRGYYNPEPMTQTLDSCLPCPPGHYCEKERLTKVSGRCEAGWFCVSAAWTSQPFDLDNYTNANCLCPATATGGRCQPGFYCPVGSSEPLPCPPGTFCNSSGLSLPMGPCSPGFYCVGGATEAKPLDGQTGNICPRGAYCVEGSGQPELCPIGTFSPVSGVSDRNACLPCPGGSFCSGVGLSAPTGLCAPGQLLLLVPLWSNYGYCSAMSSRSLCPLGSSFPLPCPAGTYQDQETQSSCMVCKPGYYCTESFGFVNTSWLQPCPKGHYCPGGTSLPNQHPCPVEGAVTATPTDKVTGGVCPESYYCPEGSIQPLICSPGTYVSVTQATHCEPCLPGWYCVSGSLYLCPAEGTGFDMGGCPKGTYGPDPGYWSVSQCKQCDGGHYCSSRNGTVVTGPCQEGYYCSHGNTSPNPQKASGNGGPCPAGHYCPIATVHPLPCPLGTFSNFTKLISQEDCQLCLPGHYCDAVGLSAPTGLCWEGFFCTEGAHRPDPVLKDNYGRGGPCPKGYYCSEGSAAPQQCPLGTISAVDGLPSCSICPQGYYCPVSNNGSTYEIYECPMGHYCPAGTWFKHLYPCPAGSINPHLQMAKLQDCQPCPPGSFCAFPGKSNASGLCRAGYYCLSGAWSPTPNDGGKTGDLCPEGYYCSQGSSAPFPCPSGYYSNNTGNADISSCLPCLPGFFCATRGLSFPTQICPAGYYCPGVVNGSFQSSVLCSPGNMCPLGSKTQLPCLPGSYQSLPGQLECVECPAGFYCAGLFDNITGQMSGTRTPLLCPRGYYCPPGTKTGIAMPCPAGTFNNQMGLPNKSSCDLCPPGQFCSSSGLTAPTGLCSPGTLSLPHIFIISPIVTSVSKALFLPCLKKAQQEAVALQGPIAHRVPPLWSRAPLELSDPKREGLLSWHASHVYLAITVLRMACLFHLDFATQVFIAQRDPKRQHRKETALLH
ncbi:hypothetical protein WMY93_028725 [Mugilogobius chulae]|uniref:Uncharacterized protein n=1 Tax=Mugilogobius chulae TaxID=88201 RepID=A0AAW0N0X2_9GOBI